MAAYQLLQELAPYLRIKAKHAATIVDYQEHVWKCRRTRDAAGRLLPLTASELATRRRFHDYMRRLNVRGVNSEARRIHRLRATPVPWAVSPSYLAGFIDGEGALMIARYRLAGSKRYLYRARISVANVNKATLEDVRESFGGILASQPGREPGWSHSYALIWSGGMVGRVLGAIRSHLRIKREQAGVLLEFLRHRTRTKQGHHGRSFAPLPPGVMRYRERLYRRLRSLNAKGPR